MEDEQAPAIAAKKPTSRTPWNKGKLRHQRGNLLLDYPVISAGVLTSAIKR